MLISMCQDVTRLQFVSCAEKDNLGGKVMMAWTENVWINAMVFVPAAKAAPKAGAKWLYSPNLIHEFTSLFSPISHRSMRLWTSVFCRRWASNCKFCPRPAQGFVFSWKNFIVQWKLILIWMLIERWRRLSMLSSICQHVARLQFVSCAEKDSLCGTVMIHDGLNLRCLYQCHGVRSHGKSSSQSWRKRIVIQESEFSL